VALRSAALLLGVLLAACANDRPRPIQPVHDLHDPSSTRRVQAVAEVRRLEAREHVPALIELLDDEDETVRLMAGTALKDLTGHDTGYRPHADAAERRRQVEEWRAWWAGRAGTGTPGTVRAP
jgi:HEAT repeat protein